MACAYIDDNTSKYKFSSSNITQEAQRLNLLNIEEVTPVVSLEKAIDRLVEFVPEIHEKVKLAKQKCATPSDGLSCDESASIYLYSMRWKPDDECLYFVLNQFLLDHNLEKLKPWNLYLRLLLTALNRLPSTRITFYQEIDRDIVKHCSIEDFFVIWDFTFLSLSVALSESKQSLGQIEKRTIFAFECCNAKFIEQHSYDSSKNEILLIPTQFQFIGYIDRRNDLDFIQLKETNTSFPLIQLTTGSYRPYPVTSIKNLNQKTAEITTSPNVSYENPKLQRLIRLHQPRSEVNLSYQNLIAEDMPIIIEKAIVEKQCTRLWLNNNWMTFDCISILVSALLNNTTLKELHLHEAGIGDFSVKILAQTLALNRSSLKTLGLNSNNITDEGAQHLAEMLKTNTTLTQLFLYENLISSRGIKLFANVLEHHNKTFKELYIDPDNSKISSSIRTITNMFKRIKH